jgi:predicted DNA-binding transcriptional regulator AlpA
MHGVLTDVGKYYPTPAEIKLLEVLLLPDNAKLNVTEKCNLAGISRTLYYELMKKPEFMRLCKDTALDLVKSEIMSLMQIGIKEAKDGSFQHWKILLEMIGMHTDKQDLQVNMTFEQLLKKALNSGDDPQD